MQPRTSLVLQWLRLLSLPVHGAPVQSLGRELGSHMLKGTAKKCVCVLVAQSCLTLCSPMDCSLPVSSVHGILQAGLLEWVAIPFSRESSRTKDQIWVFPALEADSLPSEPRRKSLPKSKNNNNNNNNSVTQKLKEKIRKKLRVPSVEQMCSRDLTQDSIAGLLYLGWCGIVSNESAKLVPSFCRSMYCMILRSISPVWEFMLDLYCWHQNWFGSLPVSHIAVHQWVKDIDGMPPLDCVCVA